MNLTPTMPALLLLAASLGVGFAVLVARHGRLDPLEQRRLHTVATARGGGLGIAVAMLLTVLLVLPLDLRTSGGLALLLASAAGAIEDVRGLRARWRLLLHLAAGALLVRGCVPDWPFLAQLALLVVVAGWVNLVNFMDGANGLIGLQALLAGIAFWLLGPDSALAPLALVLAAAVAGFLPLNFPRARVFLGDTGSYSIGLASAWLWLHAHTSDPGSGVWRGLLGLLPILTDAGLTLARRFLHGKQWYSAHREHLYQWLIRRGIPHTIISLGYAVVALTGWLLAWTLPTAWLPAGVVAFTICCVLLWQGLRLWLWRTHRASRGLRLRIRARLLKPQF